MKDAVKAYGEIVRAIAGLDQLREAVHVAQLGYNLAIPSDTNIYIARIHNWLLEEQDMLTEEIVLQTKNKEQQNDVAGIEGDSTKNQRARWQSFPGWR